MSACRIHARNNTRLVNYKKEGLHITPLGAPGIQRSVCPFPSSCRSRVRHVSIEASKGFGNPTPKKSAIKPKKQTALDKEKCPCGSGLKYENCCEVYHRGANPPTIEATLRARFSGYVKERKEFIIQTFHPDYHVVKYGTEPGAATEQLKADIDAACSRFVFYNLEVKEVQQVSDSEGHISFQYSSYNPPASTEPSEDTPNWLKDQERSRLQKIKKDAEPYRVQTIMERSKFLKEDGKWLFADFQMLEVPDWVPSTYISKRDAEEQGAKEAATA